MARPLKNSCDYFPHDADMRNHRKIKAVRNKFGIEGYAVWVMYIEYLTSCDGNRAEYTPIEFELLSGDFGLDSTFISKIIDYCVLLNLLQIDNGFISSNSLNQRLEPVYIKRGKMRDLAFSRIPSSKKPSQTKPDKAILNDHFKTNNLPPEKPKAVKTSKTNLKSKKVVLSPVINIDFDFFWNDYDKKVGDKNKLRQKWEALTDDEREKIMCYIPLYKTAQPDKTYRKNPETFITNKSWNDELIYRNSEPKSTKSVGEKFANANTLIDAMFNQ